MKDISKFEPPLFTFKPKALLRDKTYASPRIIDKSDFIKALEAMQNEARNKRSEVIASAQAIPSLDESQGGKVLRLNRLPQALQHAKGKRP